MALKEMPKVGDKVRHVDSSYVYDVSHYDGWGDAVITLPDGFTSVIPEEDFEYYELISKGADNMTHYTAEQRQARKGERIVIVEPCEHDSEDYERGDVFTVDKVDSAGVVTTTGNIVYHEEYEVLPAAMADELADAKYRADIDKFYEMAEAAGALTPDERAQYEAGGGPAYQYIEGAHGSPTPGKRDNVEKPAHYTQGKFETIDMIAQIVAGYSDPFVGHCVGTAVKYVSRAPYKHDTPLEDMRKAKRYIEFAIERLEGER